MIARRTSSSSTKAKTGSKSFGARFFLVIVFFGVFVGGIVFQMFRWQVLSRERLSDIAAGLHQERKDEFLIRGSIYASDGTVLAYDVPVYDVLISVGSNPDDLEKFQEKKDSMIDEIARILGEDKQVLIQKIDNAKSLSYLPLVKSVSVDQKRVLEARNYYGVAFQPISQRDYPNGSLASHVLGFVGKNKDGKRDGKYGIEGYYSDDLVGKAGISRLESDFSGTITLEGQYQTIESQETKDITLTIESGLQSKVEKVLKTGVEKYDATSGSVIIMNPKTGAIKAMANYPTFDPNNYSKVRDVGIYLNKSIADSIESGSVFKPLVVAAGLDSEAISSGYSCLDDKGYLEIGKWKIHTWDKKPDGRLTLGEILSNSNNVCAARVGLEVGKKELYDYYTRFGISQFVGINMQGEGTDYMRPPTDWGKADLAVASFGQMVTATNLQVISAHSAIANNGRRMQPHIVSEIKKGDEVSKFVPFVATEPVSQEVAAKVRKLMEYVSINGEPRFAFKNRNIQNYKIAGKTGTALIPDPKTGKYIENATNTLYVGMAPSDNPTFIMLVRLERPKNRTLSAYNVLPLWSDIFVEVKDDLGLVEVK